MKQEDSYPFNVPSADTFSIATDYKVTNDTLEKASQKTALDVHSLDDIHNFEEFYLLENATTSDLLNLSYSLLEDTLWPSLQPPNWQTDAARLLAQPVYIVMLTLCLLALITNILSIIAIFHIPQKLTTHLKLIVSLGSADILIVISVLLHIVNRIFNSPVSYFGLNRPSERLACACIAAIINSINIFAFLVSLLNLQAMAIDHYIGILHPWCYRRHFISPKNAYIIITLIWILSAFGGFSNFLFGYPGYKNKESFFNYCEYIMYDNFHAEYLVFGVTILDLCVIIFIYTKIWIEIKKLNTRTRFYPDEITQNKKAIYTTLFIIGTFCLCWMPNCFYQIYMILIIHYNNSDFQNLFGTYLLISKYLYILILMNCLFDPIIYAIRLKIVRKGYKNCIQKLVQRFHAIRKYLCTCKCFHRRQTCTSEHELASLHRHRPSAQPLIDSVSADADENSKTFNSDLNENKLLADTNHSPDSENEQSYVTSQESTNCFHGSKDELNYTQLQGSANGSSGNQNEHIYIQLDETINCSPRSDSEINFVNTQEPMNCSTENPENHTVVKLEESTKCSHGFQDEHYHVKLQESINCSTEGQITLNEHNYVKLVSANTSHGSQDELVCIGLQESVV